MIEYLLITKYLAQVSAHNQKCEEKIKETKSKIEIQSAILEEKSEKCRVLSPQVEMLESEHKVLFEKLQNLLQKRDELGKISLS